MPPTTVVDWALPDERRSTRRWAAASRWGGRSAPRCRAAAGDRSCTPSCSSGRSRRSGSSSPRSVPRRRSRRPAGGRSSSTQASRSTTTDAVLSTSPGERQPRPLLPQLVQDHDPGRDHLDRHRGARRLRVLVDEVQGSRLAVRRRRGDARGAAADGDHPVAAADHRRRPHRQHHDLPVPPPQQHRRRGLDRAHCFGLPFCIFILKNFISSLPKEIIEAARVDGAGHLTIFLRLVMPLSVPALASLAIFQFMWIWNDLLIGLVFGGPDNRPIIAKMVEVSRHVRSVVAPAHRRRVRLDGRPADRVLPAPAVLRARAARRSGQGMTTYQ